MPQGLASVSSVLSFADDQIKDDVAAVDQKEDPAIKTETPDVKPLSPELDNQVARLELAFNQTASVQPTISHHC